MDYSIYHNKCNIGKLLHLSFSLLTFFNRDVGFSAIDTIKCATKTGAEILGRDEELGTLEAGKLADILVIDGDVLSDISILEMGITALNESIEIVEIEDIRGDENHYSATVISKSFQGMSKINQHKMVYDAFKGKMGSELHALKLKTITE